MGQFRGLNVTPSGNPLLESLIDKELSSYEVPPTQEAMPNTRFGMAVSCVCGVVFAGVHSQAVACIADDHPLPLISSVSYKLVAFLTTGLY